MTQWASSSSTCSHTSQLRAPSRPSRMCIPDGTAQASWLSNPDWGWKYPLLRHLRPDLLQHRGKLSYSRTRKACLRCFIEALIPTLPSVHIQSSIHATYRNRKWCLKTPAMSMNVEQIWNKVSSNVSAFFSPPDNLPWTDPQMIEVCEPDLFDTCCGATQACMTASHNTTIMWACFVR